MISLVKIIFTVGVILAVIFVFKYRARIAAAHKTVMEEKARAAAKSPAAKAQDMLPCPKCGAYVASGMSCVCERA